MSYLPSKKIVFLVIIIGLVAGGWFWFPKIKNALKKEPPAKTSLKTAPQEQSNIAEKDSDNDGLKDWEEVLWKTDAKNPDTDADGTPDGKEVEEGRNPAVKGPGDKFSLSPQEKLNDEIQNKKSLNATEETARRLLDDYMTLKSGGQFLGESEKTQLINDFLRDTTYLDFSDSYSLQNIKIKSSFSRDDVKKLFNQAAEILNKNFAGADETELSIITRALRNKDEKEIEILKQYEIAYEISAKEILILASPKTYGAQFLELINILANTARAIKQMEKVLDDPLKAIVGVKDYLAQVERYKIWRDNIQRSLKRENIVFAETDSAISLFGNQLSAASQ